MTKSGFLYLQCSILHLHTLVKIKIHITNNLVEYFKKLVNVASRVPSSIQETKSRSYSYSPKEKETINRTSTVPSWSMCCTHGCGLMLRCYVHRHYILSTCYSASMLLC